MNPEIPFVDNGSGYPTLESVNNALDVFGLSSVKDVDTSFRGEEGNVPELITKCKIEHLTKDWPKMFMSYLVAIVSEEGKS
jgi:hypothetical protein